MFIRHPKSRAIIAAPLQIGSDRASCLLPQVHGSRLAPLALPDKYLPCHLVHVCQVDRAYLACPCAGIQQEEQRRLIPDGCKRAALARFDQRLDGCQTHAFYSFVWHFGRSHFTNGVMPAVRLYFIFKPEQERFEGTKSGMYPQGYARSLPGRAGSAG